jgi:zinc transport system substrate-binding protein
MYSLTRLKKDIYNTGFPCYSLVCKCELFANLFVWRLNCMKKGLKIFCAVLCMALLFSTAGCSGSPASPQSGDKPVVAVSIVPEATFAKAVCGDLAQVITIVPPGSSPETYEPTPKAMAEFSNAKIYFAIGVPTETASVLPKVPSSMKVVKLQEKVSQAYPDRKFEAGDRDPHIWLSPKRAKVMVQEMADEMSVVDSEHKQEYKANAAAYEKRLNSLDAEVKNLLTGVSSKTFLVFHPAFGYFADDYGLKMVALEQEGKESTAQHMQELVDLAKRRCKSNFLSGGKRQQTGGGLCG